jgi:hypothetical protein
VIAAGPIDARPERPGDNVSIPLTAVDTPSIDCSSTVFFFDQTPGEPDMHDPPKSFNTSAQSGHIDYTGIDSAPTGA